MKAAKWAIALTFSLALHAGAAIAFLPDAPPPLAAILGGEKMEVALLGNAFEDKIDAGTVAETVDPVETPPEEVASVAPEPSQPVTEAVAPVAPSEAVAEVAPDLAPSEADVILPADAVPPVMAEAPEVIAALPPPAVVVPEVKPEPPPEPEVAVAPPVAKPLPVKKTEPDKPKKKPQPPKAGREGQAEERAVKGRADGSESATATSAGQGKRAITAGNASFSTYAGKIHKKLSRSRKYPTRELGKGVTGTATVEFIILTSGDVTGVRVVTSAGSSALDTAAIDTVHRAAPFPKLPEDLGKSQLRFIMPVTFKQ